MFRANRITQPQLYLWLSSRQSLRAHAIDHVGKDISDRCCEESPDEYDSRPLLGGITTITTSSEVDMCDCFRGDYLNGFFLTFKLSGGVSTVGHQSHTRLLEP